MNTRKFLHLLLAVLVCAGVAAQNNPYGIYPVPHSTQQTGQRASVSEAVQIIADDGIDEYTLDRARQILEEHGKSPTIVETPSEGQTLLRLGVQESLAQAGKYDRHTVGIQRMGQTELAEIAIVGENTDATFCGLASLEQMLDADAASIACGEIQDYADVKNRGIIEGYYGVPYSVEVTKDIFRFMARYKMNMYMYGAKSDPYHSQKWADAYPTSITADQRKLGYLSQSMLRDIVRTAHQCKVGFIWAIHPGSAFTNSGNTTVISKIMTKFQSMYRLGVRQFGLCVDDVSIPTDATIQQLNADRVTELQSLIDQKWNTEGAAPADTVKPLNVVPQIYNFSQSTAANREKFYAALSATPAKVDVYITGEKTWTVPNTSDFQKGKSYMGREVSWWWNYPCNDQDVTKLFPMDTYTNFRIHRRISDEARLEADLQDAKTIIINPMQQGEASKIALFSVANYTWNNAAFDNTASWEAALPAVAGQEHAAALRFLAPYLSYYDISAFSTQSSIFASALDKGTFPTEEMQAEVQGILDACQNLHTMKSSAVESEKLFYNDIRPWLLKLEAVATEIAKLTDTAAQPADDDKWETYLNKLDYVRGLGSDNRFAFSILTGMGSSIRLSTQYAQPAEEAMVPYMGWLSENMLGEEYFTNLNAAAPVVVSNRDDIAATVTHYASTGSTFIKTTRPAVLAGGDYIGISLPEATRLENISFADTLCQHYELLCSADGKQWASVQKDATFPTDHIKYVILLNASSQERVLSLSRTELNLSLPVKLQPASATVPQNTVGFYDGHTEKYLIDGDYTTWTSIRRNQQEGDAYTVRLKKATPIHDVRICMGTENGDYMKAGLVQLSENGSTWESIPISGTTNTNYTLDDSHNVKYSSEMTYCDFDGQGKTARYVRLYLSSPNTSNWIRIYEIEVNGRLYEEYHQGLAVDASGRTIPELSDTKGITSYTAANQTQPGEVRWNFRSLCSARSLTVYQDGRSETDATVCVTTDGTEWHELGPLTGYVCRFDLTSYPFAVAAKISWTGKAPLLYEITEETEAGTDAITRVEEIDELLEDNDVTHSAVYDLSGRLVSAEANPSFSSPYPTLKKGIYIRNRRKVLVR